ncbi:hypothetical protein BJV82DRAFT_628490, partial [Fennellomyces sp. T-0311]
MVKATILALAALASLAAANSSPSKVCECVKPNGGDTIFEAQAQCCSKVHEEASDNECRFDIVSLVAFEGCCASFGGVADCQD